MTKYHINDKGEPAVCRAVKGNCPFGGDETHYKSKEDAQVVSDKRNEAEFSLLPGSKHKKASEVNNKQQIYARVAKPEDEVYMSNRKIFLEAESPTPTYIEKCRSCERIEDYSFYKKDKKDTYHFDTDRKGRKDKLENIYGEGDTVGFYEVDHQLKGNQYRKQVIEIKDTGRLIIYDKYKGHKVTTFMAHRARIETMMILAGEIPDQDFINKVKINHTNDLLRQAVDRKYGKA